MKTEIASVHYFREEDRAKNGDKLVNLRVYCGCGAVCRMWDYELKPGIDKLCEMMVMREGSLCNNKEELKYKGYRYSPETKEMEPINKLLHDKIKERKNG